MEFFYIEVEVDMSNNIRLVYIEMLCFFSVDGKSVDFFLFD